MSSHDDELLRQITNKQDNNQVLTTGSENDHNEQTGEEARGNQASMSSKRRTEPNSQYGISEEFIEPTSSDASSSSKDQCKNYSCCDPLIENNNTTVRTSVPSARPISNLSGSQDVPSVQSLDSLDRQSLLLSHQSELNKQANESSVERSSISSPKKDRHLLHSFSCDENNHRLYNSYKSPEAPTHVRQSIASEKPVLEKSKTSIGPSNLSPLHFIQTCPTTSRTHADDRKHQGDNEMIASDAASTDDLIRGYCSYSETSGSQKPTMRSSKSYDESIDHRSTTPSTPPPTPEILAREKPRFDAVSSHSLTSKDDNASCRSSSSLDPSRYYAIAAYIPSLPSVDFSNEKLVSMIENDLQRKHQLRVIAIKCSLQLDIGIVYLRNEEDKHNLVNTIQKISIDSSSNKIISFVAQLELLSYVVIECKDTKKLPVADDIFQKWIEVYNGNRPLKCGNLSDAFPNIFKIITNPCDELTNTTLKTDFLIKNQTATVYFRADCCLFDKLPWTFSENHLKHAIENQISETNISNKSIYIQYNKAEANAVVLTCDKARTWASFNAINLDEHVLTKKNELNVIYRLIVRSVPSNISVSSIKNLEIFAGTIAKAIQCGDDIILEVQNKNVYEKCVEQRCLRIDSCQMIIESYSLPSNYEDREINAYSWYETEMCTYKPDIVPFMTQPEHPIFRFKWNSQAFLEQFHRYTVKVNNEATNQQDHRDTINNQQRHLLRVTVMLNTIGILKKGSYHVGDKKIKLKSDRLETIVYNHQSKLQQSMTMPLPAAINYPYATTSVSVVNQDCLITYEDLVSQGCRPLLLNMANAFAPGGGYRKGDGAQEENLFRRSDYFRSLDMELDDGKSTARRYYTSGCTLEKLAEHDRMYPMDQFGAIYTSGLTVFRQPENVGYAFMDKPMFNVCAIAIAAYRNPKVDRNDNNLLSSKYSIRMRKKIENIFAIAHHHKHDCLILSAFGCGAFRNPPKHVATIFKSVIEQYAGFFKKIYFAIIDDHNTGQAFNPHGNYRPFQEVLDGLEIKPLREKTLDMMIGPWRILDKTSNGDIILSDIRIHDLTPCDYGGRCRDLENRQHCREYLHPPLCPHTNSAKDCELKDNKDHMLWYRHRSKCSLGAKCQLVDNPIHLSQFEHPKISRGNASLNADDNMEIEYDVHNKRRTTEESRSFLRTCPFTPFHCRLHTMFSESSNIQDLPSHVRNHCRDFLHICRFGRQCHETSSSHLEKSIHIARNMCPYENKCSKRYQEDHLNSFTHVDISDIRRLCALPAYECRDLQNREHIIRYRHCGHRDRSSVIRYCKLNKHINFVRNQQAIIARITNYANKNLQSATPLSIPHSIQECIKRLPPVYQCSKATFELILIHGHVMSQKRMRELQTPKVLIQTIQQNKQIQLMVDQYKKQSVEDHIKDYIKALVHVEYGRAHETESTVSYAGTASSQTSPKTISDEEFNNAIRKEEKFLKDVLSTKEIDVIRRYAMEMIEASLNIEMDSANIRKSSDELCDVDKHVCTILAPRLRRDCGDIVVVFKREVMLHPDANFSIESEASFLNGTVFTHRPWIEDSGIPGGRMKQFHESKLHSSIVGYDSAAAAELIAAAGINKKAMDIDLKAIVKYLTSADTDILFEGHLPDMIPLDYISEIYLPKNLFASLTPAAQLSVKSIFRDSLDITHHEINLNVTASRESRMLEKNRIEYQQYVIDKLGQKFVDNVEHLEILRGIVITLPSSHFTDHVALPFTIKQIYEQYRQNTKRDSISDEIYIYWQAIYGDMMITLSNEPIDTVEDRSRIHYIVCYISETPSTTSSNYEESYSYVNYGDPRQHTTIMDRRSFLAHSNAFHRGCNVEDFLTYCLKLEKSTGQVTLSHAGPSSIYNDETIAYKFTKSNIDLNDLNYIHISAGSRQVPIRNMMVCFHQVPDLHPSVDKNFRPSSASSRQQKHQSSDRHQSAATVQSTDDKSQSTSSKLNQCSGGSLGFDMNKKKLQPCRYSINCLQQISSEHCMRYSHPCRFAELCRNQDKEPHLTHEPHRVKTCSYDKACKDLDDPFHRAEYRHTGLPDFFIPCRDHSACRNRSREHRIKYSHGENVERTTTTADKPRTLSQAPSSSFENHSRQQHNRHDLQQKICDHESRDEQISSRYQSAYRDEDNRRHGSPYSHASEHGLKSSSNQDRSRIPCRFGSVCYNKSDADHCSTYSHSDQQRPQSSAGDNHQRMQCPSGSRCRNNDGSHLSKYSHSFK